MRVTRRSKVGALAMWPTRGSKASNGQLPIRPGQGSHHIWTRPAWFLPSILRYDWSAAHQKLAWLCPALSQERTGVMNLTTSHLTSLWRKHRGAVSKGLLEKEDAAQQVDFHWLQTSYGLRETGSGRWGACPSSHNCQVTDQIQTAHPLGRTQLFCESLLLLGTHILYWVEGEPAQPNLHMNQGHKRGALLLRQAGAPFSA